MNVEFFFHGVPAAFQEWGTTKDNNALSRFYTNEALAEQTRFVVELSTISVGQEDVYCIYYTLLKAKNFCDRTGRAGSYFGLTIRLDEDYCIDVEKIYTICESVYENDICGAITLKDGESTRYLVSNFEEKASYLQQISEEIANSIRNLNYSNIESDLIDKNRSVRTTPQFVNLSEVGSKQFWLMLKSAQRVFISEEYPTKDIHLEKLRQQLGLEQQKNKELQKQIELLSRHSNESENYRQEIKKLQKEAQELKEKNAIIEGENELKNEFGCQLQVIERPINKIADFLDIIADENNKKSTNNTANEPRGVIGCLKHNLSTIIGLLCLLLLILLVLIQTSVIEIANGNDGVITTDNNNVGFTNENQFLDSISTDSIVQQADRDTTI